MLRADSMAHAPGNRVSPAHPNCKSAHMRRRTCACQRKASSLQLEPSMNSDNQTKRNPFGVIDVPDPDGADVMQFAGTATLDGAADDVNAAAWGTAKGAGQPETIEGNWSSRWNGGADPTIAGDTADKWKQGRGEARSRGRPALSLLRLGFRRAQRPDRGKARRPAAGRKIYQSDQPCDHTSLGRQNRQRPKNRRPVSRGAPGFPALDGPIPVNGRFFHFR